MQAAPLRFGRTHAARFPSGGDLTPSRIPRVEEPARTEAPYLPRLESTAGTRTPSQRRRCCLRRCRTPRAGPGRRPAAGLRAQSEFQFRLGRVCTNSGRPGKLPGESGGKECGSGQQREAQLSPHPNPQPARLLSAHRRAPPPPPPGSEVTAAEKVGGPLGRPSPEPPAGPLEAGSVSPGLRLTLHCQEDAT